MWILGFVRMPHYRTVMSALSSFMEKHVSREQRRADDKLSAVQGTMLTISCAVLLLGFFSPQNHEETLTKLFTRMLPASAVKVFDITKARHLSQKENISSTNNNTVSIEIPCSNFLHYLSVLTVRIRLIMSQTIKALLVMGLRKWFSG